MPTIATEIGKPHPINPDWKEYYIMLEGIRLSGITNMWGAHPYLAEFAGITQNLAKDVLLSWIDNYTELKNQYWPGQAVYLKED